VTTSSPVRTPFTSSWKTTTIAYVAQKTRRVTSRVRRTARSTTSTPTTAITASAE
jgi:hypothetical protein